MKNEKTGIIYNDVCNMLDQSIQVEDESYFDGFRGPISMTVDAALADLVQNGVGVHKSVLENPSLTWDEFFNDGGGKSRAHSKAYVYHHVLLEFDSPNPNVVQIIKERSKEMLWRAREEYDNQIE